MPPGRSLRSITNTVIENRASPDNQHCSVNVRTYHACIGESVRSISNTVTKNRTSPVNQHCSVNVQTQHPCIRENVRSIFSTVTENRTSPVNQKCLDNFQTACVHQKRSVFTSNTSCKQSAVFRRCPNTTRLHQRKCPLSIQNSYREQDNLVNQQCSVNVRTYHMRASEKVFAQYPTRLQRTEQVLSISIIQTMSSQVFVHQEKCSFNIKHSYTEQSKSG